MDFIDKKLLNYAEAHSSGEEEVLNAIFRQTYLKEINPRMLSGHLQGKLLQLLVNLSKPKNILEIGTFTGYSAISMALKLGEEGRVHTIEIDREFEDTLKENILNAGVQRKVELYFGNALEIIPGILKNHKIDLVFMDADKTNYPNYYRLVKDHLPPGSLLIADNVLWSGKVLSEAEISKDPDTSAIHTYNELIVSDDDFEVILLPLRDGISVAFKK